MQDLQGFAGPSHCSCISFFFTDFVEWDIRSVPVTEQRGATELPAGDRSFASEGKKKKKRRSRHQQEGHLGTFHCVRFSSAGLFYRLLLAVVPAIPIACF